jgi:predicted Rossmann fold flavoprotein
MKTAVVGGGAAGFFLAVNLKEMMPAMEVTIFERSHHVLAKVEVSGGGRCNCTNSFALVTDLSQVYPRGHRLLKRLFNNFNYQDAYRWFEQHGVPLVTQEDQCVFPQAQDSHAIIDCFLSLVRRYHIEIRKGCKVLSLEDVSDFDYVVVTTGGSPKGEGLRWLAELGHEIESPHFSPLTTNSLVLLQVFHELADLLQLAWNADVLRTVWLTLATADAVVGLTHTRYGTV